MQIHLNSRVFLILGPSSNRKYFGPPFLPVRLDLILLSRPNFRIIFPKLIGRLHNLKRNGLLYFHTVHLNFLLEQKRTMLDQRSIIFDTLVH